MTARAWVVGWPVNSRQTGGPAQGDEPRRIACGMVGFTRQKGSVVQAAFYKIKLALRQHLRAVLYTICMNAAQKLQHLQQEIIAQNICPELAAQATQLVMGSGNPRAKIVLIGEAPGKKEDAEGKPFVGASGRFLDEMLQAADMARTDVYITNIVKYRPPNNRDPSREEIAAFWPYLLRQLEIINPRVVITLGRHSGACFIPKLVISEAHGQTRPVTVGEHECTLIPLYHPAAALYNGSMRQVLIDDFLAAAKVANAVK